MLLVEDDGTLRTLYVDLLEHEGFDVDQAVEGNEGLAKAKTGGYDIILLDLLLPGISGQQILETLKDTPPPIPNGPIIVLTNQEQPEILTRCQESGAKGVIIKSRIAPDQFVPSILSFVEKKDVQKENT